MSFQLDGNAPIARLHFRWWPTLRCILDLQKSIGNVPYLFILSMIFYSQSLYTYHLTQSWQGTRKFITVSFFSANSFFACNNHVLTMRHCAWDNAVCVWQQTALCCSNGRGQGSSIAASCHTPDLKRQCANSVHTHTHTHTHTQLYTSYYTQAASLEEMKHHCHT